MDIKKAWNLTVAIPRSEAFALPNSSKTATRSPRRYKSTLSLKFGFMIYSYP